MLKTTEQSKGEKIQNPGCRYFSVTLWSVVSFKNLQQFLLLLY